MCFMLAERAARSGRSYNEMNERWPLVVVSKKMHVRAKLKYVLEYLCMAWLAFEQKNIHGCSLHGKGEENLRLHMLSE